MVRRHHTHDEIAERDALIYKRLDEGLQPSVVARRLGINYEEIKRAVRRRATMAKNEVVDMSGLQTKFEAVRDAVRVHVKSGLQTHEAQDSTLVIIRLLDECEAETKVLGLNKEK